MEHIPDEWWSQDYRLNVYVDRPAGSLVHLQHWIACGVGVWSYQGQPGLANVEVFLREPGARMP